jgi:hypothetical protein
VDVTAAMSEKSIGKEITFTVLPSGAPDLMMSAIHQEEGAL